MSAIFNCSKPGCPGVIDANNFFFPPVRGCTISHISYACPVCALIHWPEGEPKSFTPGFRAYLVRGAKGPEITQVATEVCPSCP